MVTVLLLCQNCIQQETMGNLSGFNFSGVCCQSHTEIFAFLDHCIVGCLLAD